MVHFKEGSSFDINASLYSISPLDSLALDKAVQELDTELQNSLSAGSHLNGVARKLFIKQLIDNYSAALGRLLQIAQETGSSEKLLLESKRAVSDLQKTAQDFLTQKEIYEEKKDQVESRLDHFAQDLFNSTPSLHFEEFSPPSVREQSPLSLALETEAVELELQRWIDQAEQLKRPFRDQLVERVTNQGNQILNNQRMAQTSEPDYLREEQFMLSMAKLRFGATQFILNLPEDRYTKEKSV